MNLDDISNKYQENLVEFFNNEKVIDLIYEEQYGKEYYAQNKEKCRKEYKDILDNTIFVPYITIEHLENFIKSAKNKHGIKYVGKHLADENHLLTKLYIKRDSIIRNESSLLFKELQELNPKLNNIDLTRALYDNHQIDSSENTKTIDNELEEKLQESASTIPGNFAKFFDSFISKAKNADLINKPANQINDVDSIIANLEKILNENKQNLHPIKNKKIAQLLRKYGIDVKEKILIETSSYFKHKRDVAEKFRYVPIIENLTKGGQFVEEHIDKNSQNNFRYIYLPVLKYKSKHDFLKVAIHEVMHISKEKINGMKYKSGLLNSLTVKKHPIKSFIQSIKWSKFKKSFSKENNIIFPVEIEKYQSYSGEIAIDEVVHHWQVRNVVKKILDTDLINKFEMPYINEHDQNEITSYEFADNTTSKFMDYFGDDMKEINNGNLSVRSFKRKVGVSSYDSLSHLFDIWTSAKPKTAPLQSTIDAPSYFYNAHQIYSEMGNNIVNQMRFNASKVRKDTVLKRTINVKASKICEIGTFLDHTIEPSLLSSKNNKSIQKQIKNDEIER